MSRPVGGPGAGGPPAASRSVEARENYGQLRSQVAHAINDLRKAQRTGDAEGLLSAAHQLANVLGVELGATEGKTGAQLLELLGEKLGMDPQQITPDSLRDFQRAATDRTRLSSLINDV